MNHLPPLADLLSSQASDPKLLLSSQASSYLNHLTTLSLPLLLAEPQSLSSEADALTSQLTTLCTSEYSTFLSIHSTFTRLSDRLESLASSLESLIDSIPELESETRTFAECTKTVQSQRRKAGIVLEQHDKLLDILQIPQLIDTCVRNGYYGEAMDLSAHATALLARFPTVPIIIDVAAEAEQAIKLMISQLLGLLRVPAKLPALFKAVNFLRRMGSLDEEELALAFLTSRATYLQDLFDDIEAQRTDHARYLRRYVDIFREGVYDLVTQYTTIFLDRSAENPDLRAALFHFLQIYTHTYLSRLVALLGSTVPQIDDPTLLMSLLTQLTYCSTSFARIGLDFRSSLHQPFADAVLSAMTTAFANAAEEFAGKLDQNSQTPLSTWFVTSTFLSSLSRKSLPSFDNNAPTHVPPGVLSSFPPFAIYTNSIINALNSLRLFAPTSLQPQILALLEASLAKVGQCLLSRLHMPATTTTPEEKRQQEEADVNGLVLEAAGVVYLRCLLPFLVRALTEGIYGVPRLEGQEHDEGSGMKDVKKGLRERLFSGTNSEDSPPNT